MNSPPDLERQRLVMIGAGGHARVLMSALEAMHIPVQALCLPPLALIPPWGQGIPTLSSDAQLLEAFDPRTTLMILGVGATGNNHKRSALFAHYRQQGYRFATILHPRHYHAADVTLGEGCQVMVGSIMQSGVEIHDNVIINTGACIDHECIIESHV
ncbi:MAG: shikimate dehydrogenase, partial [Magnetococcales bacterium]|nr:shikimate dehydrogenase [Magnetococcales bacterium]